MTVTAVLEAFQAFTGNGIDRIGWQLRSDVGVRWPNDLVSGEGPLKCGGLLIHARTSGNNVRVHLGIGINGSDRTVDDIHHRRIMEDSLEGLGERIHHALAGWFMKHPRYRSQTSMQCDEHGGRLREKHV